jgi:DNA repair protein RecO (recombination protein O)
MLTKDTAVCIRVVDYSETSQIVTFFTKANGKIGAIARGSKRPKSAFDGPIEMFSYGEIVFSDPAKEKLATLTEFQQHGFTDLTSNLFAFNCCLFAAELLNKLTHDNDPHPELFDSFLQFLHDVSEHRAYPEPGRRISSIEHQDILSLLILFQLTLLREIGLMPILNACANCKKRYDKQITSDERRVTSDEFYFSSSANGLICRDCEASFPDKIKLSKYAAACLNNLKLIADADEKTLREIEKILIAHFTELLGHRPKMAKHILKS